MLLALLGAILFLPMAMGHGPENEEFQRNRDIAAMLLLFSVPVGLGLCAASSFLLSRVRRIAIIVLWLTPLAYGCIAGYFVVQTLHYAGP